MKTPLDPHLKRDFIKLACVGAVIAGVIGIFFVTPALSTPTMISILMTMLLSPWVAVLERRNYPRTLSILILFGCLGVLVAIAGAWAAHSGLSEWKSFEQKAPEYFHAVVQKIRDLETSYQNQYPVLKNVHVSDSLINWGRQTGAWFVVNGPGLMGSLLSCLFIAPLLTFFMLNDGRAMRRQFFHLVPNRFFESVFIVTSEIGNALSDYLRAKLIEAFLVGLMTTLGLALVQAPYAVVLGILAGVTNILPYAGPVLGAIPGLLIAAFDTSHPGLLLGMSLVYIIANIIDMILIFPIIVAKLVDLHPLILIAAVTLGQQYYGLVGMLISIPIATALKVILQEIHSAVYEQRGGRGKLAPKTPIDDAPLLLKSG